MEKSDSTFVESSAIEQMSRAEIDIQIATAKRYPRDLVAVRRRIEELATTDQETAEKCFYRLERSGKDGKKIIEGESVRLAEICLHAWGNLRVQSQIIGEDERCITARGMVHDLENNVAVSKETRVRCTTKSGARYSDDMMVMAANNASARAIRDAVFKAIPKAFIKQITRTIHECAMGKVSQIEVSFQRCVEQFAAMGVDRNQILAKVERKAASAITREDLLRLKQILTALHDGDAHVEDEFAPPSPPEQSQIAAFWAMANAEKILEIIERTPAIVEEIKSGPTHDRLTEIRAQAIAIRDAEKVPASAAPASAAAPIPKAAKKSAAPTTEAQAAQGDDPW